MNRAITTEQSQQLFQFCREHYVYHYDLQVELVDHLASAIEEQWQKNPELAFEKALQHTFSKFGITGFSKIKEQKQKELRRKYNRMQWHFLLDFFSWPKILLTTACTLLLSTLFKFANNDLWIIASYFGTIFIFLIYYYRIYPKYFKPGKIKGKRFMLLEQLQGTRFMIILFFQLPTFWNMFKDLAPQNNITISVISLLIIVFTIALYGQLFFVPQKIKQHFIQQFPEFAL